MIDHARFHLSGEAPRTAADGNGPRGAPGGQALSREPLEDAIDALQSLIRALAAERQGMRDRGASRGDLESNRRELICREHQLAHALIGFHLPRVENALSS